MIFHLEILSKTQKEITEKLGFLNRFSCYLAGGTALAIQLGHRTSLDLDFYTREQFTNTDVEKIIREKIPETKLMKDQPDKSIQGKISGVKFSLFCYDYKLVYPLVDFPPIKLASIEDIAAMKIAAIVQRAKQRDFFDLYYLIEKVGLENIIKITYQKYPWYEENNKILFKALNYFDEADKDEEISAVKIFDHNVNWLIVKKRISKEVKNYLFA